MNYNCLAVDLRSGGKYEFTENETAKRARNKGLNTSLSDSEADILASMKYIRSLSKKQFLLLGSSSSASLCLKLAINNPDVKGIMAFSPGEFFRPALDISECLHDLDKSVFATGSGAEIPYIIDMFHGVESQLLSIYKPISVHEKRGVSILLDTTTIGKEYWLALLIYIKSL
jgi:pimeloyl-ACP methyl ester carboxylesterase